LFVPTVCTKNGFFFPLAKKAMFLSLDGKMYTDLTQK
jgi:hypothetical protein